MRSASQTDTIKEYIEHRTNDSWYQHYEVVCELYYMFTRGDEEYMYARYEIMCEEIK